MEEINTNPDDKKVPSYKKILVEEYWKLPDNKFTETVNETIEEVKNGELELISMDIITLQTIFLNGMNLASLHSSYCPNVDEELGKVVIREESQNIDEEMRDVMLRFEILNNQLLEKEYREKADDIFKCIPIKMEQFYARFDKECENIPILKYYDAFQIFQRVSCASNEDIVLIKEKLKSL